MEEQMDICPRCLEPFEHTCGDRQRTEPITDDRLAEVERAMDSAMDELGVNEMTLEEAVDRGILTRTADGFKVA